MKEFDWRVQYAPQGYRYVRNRLPFEALDNAYNPAALITLALKRLRRELALDLVERGGRFDDDRIFTRLSVFPKQTGESLNHLDPLVPRLGIEIELRYPVG